MDTLIAPVLQRLRDANKQLDTFDTAKDAHEGQLRKSGDPYITHPVAVAEILVEFGLDPATIAAALLHDTVEDTSYSAERLRVDFGDEVANLVEGVTKLDRLTYGPTAEAETVRKTSEF
jgi:guanosine-3',5'-bis(diphosphate) 3'-pyrophosphohydrolase